MGAIGRSVAGRLWGRFHHHRVSVSALRPLFIAPYGDFGGSESVLLKLIEALGDRLDPSAVVMRAGTLAARLREADVPTEVVDLPGRLSMPRIPATAARLAERYAETGLSFIHANGLKAAVLGVPLARRLGVPLVWMKHDHAYEGPLTRLVAARCERVICVSHTMAELLGADLAERVSVVYPGIDLDPRSPSARTELLVMSAGRLDPRKAFRTLIDAVALLHEDGCKAQLVIAGLEYPPAPRHGEELRRHAQRIGIGDTTHIGRVDDISHEYRRARVVAVTSKKLRGRPAEGAPLVLMEGMSHGRPAVGPEEGGVREVVGEAGTLVAERTPRGYADALRKYLDDPKMALDVGRLGRRRAEERFAFDRMVTGVAAAYDEVARARST